MASPSQPQTSPPPSSPPEQHEQTPEEAANISEAEDEEDEEEEEPQLKYERVGGDIAKVIRGDLVSAFCVGLKYIVCFH